MNLEMLGLLAIWVVLGLLGALAYLLLVQHGRLLLRIEALERQGADVGSAGDGRSPGLPIGSVVHDFDLPDLAGGRATLSGWRGRRLCLIFVDPRCPYSQALLPDLAPLVADPGNDRPQPVILSSGDPEENRRWMDVAGVHCTVLLQEQSEVATLYQIDGTPMAYLIDESGRTASAVAVGAEAVLALVGSALPGGGDQPGSEQLADGSTYPRGKTTRSETRSRLVRDGLPAGTRAPDFRLSRLDGGDLSLEELRGRPVLLVFSDPACGPCDLLAPELEQLHRRASYLQVVMVSRGDVAANRAKAAAYDLTFPIVVQQRWEISRAYGMFATPIGYLIDSNGVIDAGVAVGAQAILALADGNASPGEGSQDALSRA
jgi:peroxiredoxin